MFRAIFIALMLSLTAGIVFARGGGGCVEQGGMIETPGGRRAIESLAVGEAVWSWRDGKRVEGRVLACYRVEPESFIDLTLAGGTLHVTGEHPVATSLGAFRQARNFHVGDHAMLWRGDALVDGVVEAVAVRKADKPAFNLSVYPGGQFVADGVLVHNKGGGCFLPHTPVLMSDGSARPIGEVKPGDKVLALSPDERVVEATVQRVFTLPADEYWVVQTDRGSVEVTGEHPFYVGRGEFRTAESLRVGDAVYSRDGPGVSLQRVESLRRIFRGVTVVNLQTDEPHTFFAAGFAVHNKGGCFPAGTKIATPSGDVDIERVSPGDVVTAVDDRGRRVAVKVTSLLVQRDYVLTLTTTAGVLHTTSEHPICVGPGRFVAAGDLAVGAEIQRHDGAAFVSARVTSMSRGDALATVYNLSVDDPHTFLADGFVVHNKGGGCFPAGTAITTPAGATAIERVSHGDVVMAVDERGGRVAVKVDSLLVQRDYLFTLTTTAGVLRTTAEHPLCVGPGQFIPAGEVTIGAVIQRQEGASFMPARVLSKSLGTELVTVYNLSVEGPHTFIADGFVVHNKGGFGGGGSSFRSSGSGSSWGRGRGSTQPFDSGCMVYAVVLFGIPLISFIWKLLHSNAGSLIGFGSSGGTSRAVFKVKDGNLDQIIGVNDIVKKSEPTERLLDALARNDASFAKEQVKANVVEAFTTLQLCWTQRQYGLMRPLVTQEIAQQHEHQIASMSRQHEINRIENIQILRTDFVHVIATKNPRQKQVTALITAQMSDYYVDDRNGEFRRGNRVPEPFQEFWTFTWDNRWLLAEIEQVRESDALREKNNVEGYDQDASTLAEVAEEPTFRNSGPGTGSNDGKLTKLIQQLSVSDPLWRPSALSATARSIFTRVMVVREAGDESQLTERDFTPALIGVLSRQIVSARAAGREVEYRNLCVRKVQLVHADDGRSGRPAEFTARIVAHAQTVVRENGSVKSEDPYVTTFTEYYTFVRQGGGWRASEIKPQGDVVSES